QPVAPLNMGRPDRVEGAAGGPMRRPVERRSAPAAGTRRIGGLAMHLRTIKYRLLRRSLWVGNRTLAWALNPGLAPAAFALLETVGRNTDRPRQTPVGNGLDGDTFWLIAAHGHHADFVRNIQAHPVVRVKVGGSWRTGTATLMPDDDTARRSRA